ncbi:MAG TPA: sulfurtransferase TusA family protein, partial [Nannocystaceae bacterium]|nr:sulfurtransferase TusA family protein [Nannocystaceae bacterium]
MSDATRGDSADASIDLGALGLDAGAEVMLGRALARCDAGARVDVRGSAPDLAVHLPAWCRAKGHAVVALEASAGTVRATIEVGRHTHARAVGATRAGRPDPREPGAVVDAPDPRWGLAARGALVEAGTSAVAFALGKKDEVWADEAVALYAQATAAQWDPDTAIPWDAAIEHDDVVEDAIVQVMTYLVENETAALIVPARFLGQIHPHFREVMQLLAVQVADEARHIEVFTRRAQLRRAVLGTSSAGGQAS